MLIQLEILTVFDFKVFFHVQIQWVQADQIGAEQMKGHQEASKIENRF